MATSIVNSASLLNFIGLVIGGEVDSLFALGHHSSGVASVRAIDLRWSDQTDRSSATGK